MNRIFGYLTILIRGGKSEEEYKEKRAKYRDMKEKIDGLNKRIENLDDKIKKNEIEWKDVGEEFKKGLLNLGQSINKLFEDSKFKDRNANKDKDKINNKDKDKKPKKK